VLINPVKAQQPFYEKVREQDSIFSVYLEEDTLNDYYSVFLVFKNKTSDSIVLTSKFEYFIDRLYYTPGIYINFYIKQELGLLNWGELRPEYFKFSNGKTHVPPRSIIRFPIVLPYIGKIKDEVEKGLVFEVFYFYYNVTQKRANSFYVKTNYLNLKYLKKFQREDH
jgi:hypothetical protein